MKMIDDHFKTLADAITPLIDKYPCAKHTAAGMSEKRWRWDLLYVAKLTPFVCNELYPYLNDTHIDTALRKITGTRK